MWISGYIFFHWVSLFGAKNLSLIKKQPLKVLGRMHCMLMDLLHGFEVLSTTEETLFNSRNVFASVPLPRESENTYRQI